MKKTNALRILDRHKVEYQLVEYQYSEDNLSVEQIAADNQLPLPQVFKTLVVKGDKQGVMVALIPGHGQLSFKALARASGNKKVTTVPVKDLERLTGYIRGGCSPLGMKKAFPLYMDQSALDFADIYVNAGKKGLLVRLSPQELQRVAGGQVALLAEG
ncbi:MAG: Cys-tRNA(Pro) deacylase [Bacteroidota bacterium]